jgi:glycosyltransferase involved in cell wall biosynthesis
MRLYADADCLVFPSKLETWGMPITEFKATGKPILAVDLPYAHETVGDYDRAAFVPIGNHEKLATMMQKAASGEDIFCIHSALRIAEPFCRDWSELWAILLS